MPEMIAPGVLNFASQIDDNTIDQAKRIAELPFVEPHVALMPDAHSGKGSAVGTVIPTVGAVIPAAVGVDVGCGVIAVQTDFWAEELDHDTLVYIKKALELEIPLSPGNYNKSVIRESAAQRIRNLELLAKADAVDLSHSPKWREQLGSLGGGNHFIELCVSDSGFVWLFLHSGSRGVGNKIAQRHIKIARSLMKKWHIELSDPDLAYLPTGTPEFSNYIRELRWAQEFALENRAEMMDRFTDIFGSVTSATEVDRINSHHNYTENVSMGNGKSVWLTRKGAVDATEGKPGLIPGSMGTRSYVVNGKGNESAFWSAPHGAGRRFSRTEARRRFTADDLAARMTGIVYRHGDEWIDEIPDAYKNIDTVMEDSKELVEVVTSLKQLINVKGV